MKLYKKVICSVFEAKGGGKEISTEKLRFVEKINRQNVNSTF